MNCFISYNNDCSKTAIVRLIIAISWSWEQDFMTLSLVHNAWYIGYLLTGFSGEIYSLGSITPREERRHRQTRQQADGAYYS